MPLPPPLARQGTGKQTKGASQALAGQPALAGQGVGIVNGIEHGAGRRLQRHMGQQFATAGQPMFVATQGRQVVPDPMAQGKLAGHQA